MLIVLQVKLGNAIDESEYTDALKELCSVSTMSSFMNASLLLSSLSDYNSATRAQLWPCIDLVKDGASVLSTRLQRLEMIGVVLVSIQSMVEKLQSHAEKTASLNSGIKATGGSGLEFMTRHYSDAVTPQLGQARNAHVARRIVAAAFSISQSAGSISAVACESSESGVLHSAPPVEEVAQEWLVVDDLSLESARSSSSQAGGYFVDPSMIIVPSGSVGSATVPLRLSAAGRHEQQVRLKSFVYICLSVLSEFHVVFNPTAILL